MWLIDTTWREMIDYCRKTLHRVVIRSRVGNPIQNEMTNRKVCWWLIRGFHSEWRKTLSLNIWNELIISPEYNIVCTVIKSISTSRNNININYVIAYTPLTLFQWSYIVNSYNIIVNIKHHSGSNDTTHIITTDI